ncbi:MAG: WD40 repeat domain-containing protein [Parachlamydiales bacterium]
MSSVPQISGNASNASKVANLVDTKDIVKSWPEEVIYECSKHINKLCDIRTLSSLSKHFFLVVFNDKFPRWQTLLTSHFPTSFQLKQPIAQPFSCYKHLKAIDHQFKAGTFQTRSFLAHQPMVHLYVPPFLDAEMANMIIAHQSSVRYLDLQDGNLISAAWEPSIAIWDLQSGDLKGRLVMDQENGFCMTVKDKKVFSGYSDGIIKIWDFEKGEMLHRLEGHKGAVVFVKEDDEKLISSSGDGQIKIWDIATGELLHTLEGDQVGNEAYPFNHIEVKEGKLITDSRPTASTSTIKVWDLQSGKTLFTGDAVHTHLMTGLSVEDGKIISGSHDSTIKIWDFESGALLHTLDQHQGGICSLLVHNGKIISGSQDHTIKIWNLEDGEELHTLDGHQRDINLLKVKDGILFSGSKEENAIKVWDLESGKLLRSLDVPEGRIECLEIKDEMLVAGLHGGIVKIFDFTPPSKSR